MVALVTFLLGTSTPYPTPPHTVWPVQYGGRAGGEGEGRALGLASSSWNGTSKLYRNAIKTVIALEG